MSTKNYRKAPFSEVEAALGLLGVTESELSRRLGYSDNWAAGCKTTGEIPFVASVAIRMLLEEAGKQTPPPLPRQARTLICVVVTGAENADAIDRMLTMSGQRTWKINLEERS